jgi:hypothetical protein
MKFGGSKERFNEKLSKNDFKIHHVNFHCHELLINTNNKTPFVKIRG